MKKVILFVLLTFFSLDLKAQRVQNDEIEKQVIKLMHLFQSKDSLGFLNEFATIKSKVYELAYNDDEEYKSDLKSDEYEHSKQIVTFRKFHLERVWRELYNVYYDDGIIWENVNIDAVLLFEDFDFDYLKEIYNLEKYQVYIFCTDMKSGEKWVSECGIRFYSKNDLCDFYIDAVHQAKDLVEYIKVRGEKDMIESHPESVNKYLGW